jgi:hypothetical protein
MLFCLPKADAGFDLIKRLEPLVCPYLFVLHSSMGIQKDHLALAQIYKKYSKVS